MKTTIFVEPVGKARPRTVTKGGRTWTYTPKGTASTESKIREHCLKLNEYFDHGIPLKVEATFYRLRPKSLPKRVQLPVTKPDWDNSAKLLMDSIEKFIFPSDSAITTCLIKKRFAEAGSPPRIELSIEHDSS